MIPQIIKAIAIISIIMIKLLMKMKFSKIIICFSILFYTIYCAIIKHIVLRLLHLPFL